MRPFKPENARVLEPILVYPSFGSNYLLSCLSDTQMLERKKFDAKIESAEAALVHGQELDKLYYVCLSLNEKADYKKFKHGLNVLKQYIIDHPDSGKDLQGIRILIDRLDEEIMNRWSAWKSLLNDKKELSSEVESLTVKIKEQLEQIDKLKNIENIIKSRETKQP